MSGFFTADDMGLGKTLTMISLGLWQKQHGASPPEEVEDPKTGGKMVYRDSAQRVPCESGTARHCIFQMLNLKI